MTNEELQEFDAIMDRLIALDFYTEADALAARIRARHQAGWGIKEYHEWMAGIGIEL